MPKPHDPAVDSSSFRTLACRRRLTAQWPMRCPSLCTVQPLTHFQFLGHVVCLECGQPSVGVALDAVHHSTLLVTPYMGLPAPRGGMPCMDRDRGSAALRTVFVRQSIYRKYGNSPPVNPAHALTRVTNV
jgi:hypothetical protein